MASGTFGKVGQQDVLAFWYEEAGADQWFAKSDAFDLEIKTRFQTLVEMLDAEIDLTGLSPWEASGPGALASVIALDQFPRNIYRGTPRAFAFDEKARSIASRAIDAGLDDAMASEQRHFLYMPYMHVEDLASQERCVELFETRLSDPGLVRFAVEHRDIIERFGRFPHRNVILGRMSTPEEEEFLAGDGFKG